MSEVLRIFDENYQYQGTATRDEAHAQGLWHETFHCWLYYWQEDELQLIVQKRASGKKDFPDKFDISAAGHLLANERPLDGLRELSEELGIEVAPNHVTSIGCYPVAVDWQDFHDREFPNLFLLEQNFEPSAFSLQEEEVGGLYRISLAEFEKVMQNPDYWTEITGFTQENGEKIICHEKISQENTCCHSLNYFEYLFKKIHEILL